MRPTAGAAGRSTCSKPRSERARATAARGPAALLAVPAAGVPVPARLRVVVRDDDLVALAGPDLVVAARAAVRLHRLVRLHVADLDRVGSSSGSRTVGHGQPPKTAQTTSPAITTNAAVDHDDVGAPLHLAPERVQSHGPTVIGKSGGAATRARGHAGGVEPMTQVMTREALEAGRRHVLGRPWARVSWRWWSAPGARGPHGARGGGARSRGRDGGRLRLARGSRHTEGRLGVAADAAHPDELRVPTWSRGPATGGRSPATSSTWTWTWARRACRRGARLRVGTAVVEVTEQPHTGCAKFAERFGDPGRPLREHARG